MHCVLRRGDRHRSLSRRWQKVRSSVVQLAVTADGRAHTRSAASSMQAPTEEMVEWAKSAHLHMPLEFYDIALQAGGAVLSPLGTTSLQPTADFRRAIGRLEAAAPDDESLLHDVEHAEVSNLVIHGATSEPGSHAATQNAEAVLGTAPQQMDYGIPLHAKAMSSDQCTGITAHTRLTVRRLRQGTSRSGAEAHAQQIMSFGNEYNQPPHQVLPPPRPALLPVGLGFCAIVQHPDGLAVFVAFLVPVCSLLPVDCLRARHTYRFGLAPVGTSTAASGSSRTRSAATRCQRAPGGRCASSTPLPSSTFARHGIASTLPSSRP